MYEKEVVLFSCGVIRAVRRCDQESGSCVLACGELSCGISDGPAVPVFEKKSLRQRIVEDGAMVIFALGFEEIVEAGIGRDFGEDFEW